MNKDTMWWLMRKGTPESAAWAHPKCNTSVKALHLYQNVRDMPSKDADNATMSAFLLHRKSLFPGDFRVILLGLSPSDCRNRRMVKAIPKREAFSRLGIETRIVYLCKCGYI